MEVNLLIAFGSGIVSFLAPCVVPLMPAYVGYISGVSLSDLKETGNENIFKKKIMISSLMYVLGFSLVFVLMGTTAASLSFFLRTNGFLIQRWGGVLIMLLALNFLGVFRPMFLERDFKFALPGWTAKLGYGRAFLVGVIFASAWTPCIGPVLGVILTLAAASKTVLEGAMLLFAYSMGITLPFLVASLFLAKIGNFLRKYTKQMVVLNKVMGVFLFVIGFLLFNNTMLWFSESLTYNGLNGFLVGLVGSFGLAVK